jgi:hypothetical protein
MELKEGKNYLIAVTTQFDGQFKGYEMVNGVRCAVFQQAGRTDRGSIPYRRVPVNNIVSSELVKY